jgi:DNA-binding NarL/FixJ family response regulator
MPVTRLLFVDDHPLYRSGVQLALSHTFPGASIWLAGSAEEALAMFEAGLDLDLCLTDLRLPSIDGVSLLEAVGRGWPTTARALLCADPSPELARRARAMGCVGCLSKARDMDELAEALADILQGAEVFDGESDAPGALSAKRLQILDLAARGRSNKEIARTLGITERTVKDHWQHIFARLDVANRVEAVSKAHHLRLI